VWGVHCVGEVKSTEGKSFTRACERPYCRLLAKELILCKGGLSGKDGEEGTADAKEQNGLIGHYMVVCAQRYSSTDTRSAIVF
jgi:hypothetical protein